MSSILTKVNWFGLAGGAVTILMIAVSMVYPWWQLTVGDGLLTLNVSPVSMNMGLLETWLTVPFIWALTLVGILGLLSSAIAMLIYSVLPRKSYSMHLLGFGYKKPLYAVLFFVIGLVVTTVICQMVLNFNIPWSGSATNTLPLPFTSGVTISVLLSAGFQWSFWLAIVAAGLCLAARIYHKKVSAAPSVSSKAPAPKA